MPVNDHRTKFIIAGSLLLAGAAIYIQSSKTPFIKPKQVIYPPSSTIKNRIFLSIREPQELDSIKSLKQPLLMNFIFRGDLASDKLTSNLQKIVGFDMDENKLINLVDIESDELPNRDLLMEYGVTKIPTVVLLVNQLKRGEYIDEKLIESKGEIDPNYDELKNWVESHSANK
ncbi:hypothetical protein CANARDRAFT_200699 [[Candida] arabinofermentans NRRL YB-2248]|uniref:Thioredoxin domain-containing protein n=1 Tax=[Candida] arabinofermentans NRRL YB-2248 TaxID=983967 RepID=A0A1E4SYB7_9ASCO|nr:hypothetical protein CANARDRAFT_200699 [[Candida] arabinofermentans NRRL YB-2248]